MTEAYAYWNAALAHRDNPKLPQPDFDTRRPETGFYRGQHNEAIAIWWAGDICLAKVHAPARTGTGLTVRDYNKADQISDSLFSYCCRHPITHAAYKEFVTKGIWPEDIRSINKPTADEGSPSVPVNESGTGTLENNAPADSGESSPAIGDNLPKEPEKAIDAQVADLLERANAWLKTVGGKIDNQVDADKCSNFGVAMASLEKQAETSRETEKRPHLEAGRAVDAKWNVVIDKAAKAKANLKSMLTSWLRKQRDAQDAEQAKAAEARRAAAAQGQPVPLQRAEPSRSVAGTTGRVALKTVTVFTVSDIKAASAYLAGMETPPNEFMEAVRLCGSRLIKAGAAVPGIATHNEDIAV